jgi:hypothetical protein
MPNAVNDNFLDMKNSIIFISALSLMVMMLASCDSIPGAFNPFGPTETTTTSTSDPAVTGQTNRPTYQMPLGRENNSVPTDY